MMFSDASLACLNAIPAQLLETSSSRGWTSLLVGTHRSDPAHTVHETSPTSDLTLGVAMTGAHRLEALESGVWRSATYGSGACGLTLPFETDRLRWASDVPFEAAHLYLPALLIEETAEDLRRAGQRNAASSLSALVFNDPALVTTVRALLAAARAGAPDLYAQQAAQWLTVHLLTAQGGTGQEERSPSGHLLTDARLARTVSFIQARYAEPLSLNTLASEAGVSRYHFSRLFKACTGRAPHAFLTEVRLKAARAMLRGSDLPIARVAELCGYGRPDQFGVLFKCAHGMTPVQFRKHRPTREPAEHRTAVAGWA